MLMNAAISLHQGKSTPAELGQAAQVVATKFSSQYTPYIKTTGGAITTGATKLMNVVRSCAGGNSGPVFIDPAMAGKNGCALPGKINTSAAYGTPYRSYR
ncbi:MAG: hypothetical protein H6867_09195 [Rhodospirillales bacterium]|nr:hypothetical protein [Rhodospirillales bacterium]MCB9996024.1 hypothetical protein [Rhodospirillales bacterium]